ncbi:hypothetical protein [endosymbiont GvMRE of Glomus versiforme]|uniref:hypothetical protein n=1 Tax=endosymbiont GvMRE of Glomus versiforme TaxID=2039283 RepID=UPI000EC91806|nr:hypothetical protein [endosymbiont GvMRE of Glomus versiforme]RHZ36438.1 hypothetical protein GvMRE_Ic1g186 [endosymbiont GvMRE of Glomus versiforme]
MYVDKQKLSELLQKKGYWEKRKNHYYFQYHSLVDNAWLWPMATTGITYIGSEWIKKESIWDKVWGWIFWAVAIILLFLLIIRAFKIYPYERKIKICER